MKLLILNQSSLLPPYDKLMWAQRATWDSFPVKDVTTIYYYGGEKFDFKFNRNIDSIELCTGTSDEYNMMHWKFKKCLDFVHDLGIEFDMAFRTNSSSYVDKQMTLDFAKDKPRTGYYSGRPNGETASGCGMFMSPDVCDIIRTQFDDYPSPAEDILCGTYLIRNGIRNAEQWERVDYYFGDDITKNTYHYRCKSDTEDRTKDIQAFNNIFKMKHG